MPRLQHLILLSLVSGVLYFFYFLSNNVSSLKTSPWLSPPESGYTTTPDFTIPLQDVPLQETRIPGNAVAHGFTVFDSLYLRGGTFYVVTKDRASFPELRHILSHPVDLGKGDEPTDKELQFIEPLQAEELLEKEHMQVNGVTIFVYDNPQFLAHFYHWFGEVILGLWRVYSKLEETEKSLPMPNRFVTPFASQTEWRDRAGVDALLMRAAFPDAPIESSDYWQDLEKLERTVVFERAVIVNRAAAHRHRFGSVWFKMMASTMAVDVRANFWQPVREAVARNLLGRLPLPPPKPLVTYVSRQGGGRRLLAADHDALVEALEELMQQGICEFKVVQFEKMKLKEQVEVMAKSTIMLGVHGNGLTHQLWMPPTPKSTVIEIFYPGGYLFDYEMLARNMGHKHYGVWNDTFVNYPEGEYHKDAQGKNPEFHGTKIPVHGPSVAQLVRERLAA